MTITNFDSGAFANNPGVTEATYSGWTFGSFDNSTLIDIVNGDNSSSATTVPLNQSGGRSILLNSTGNSDFYFKSSDGSDFQLNSFSIDNGNGTSQYTLGVLVTGYRDGVLVTLIENIALGSNYSSNDITYDRAINNYPSYGGQMVFGSVYSNVDEIRLTTSTNNQLSIDNIDISLVPSITSATYDASTNALVVTGFNMTATAGAANDIDVSKLTLTGQGGATYILTSPNVELDSTTQFTVALNAIDQTNIAGLLNNDGTSSVSGGTYNIAAAVGWDPAVSGNSDLTGNGVTVSNVQIPTIVSAVYDASTGTLNVTGSNLVNASGAANDIDASLLTFTGEGGSTYTLTDTSDVEITSGTAFTIVLSAADKAAIDQIVNKNGASSTDGTSYNLAAADDWNTSIGNTNIADTTGNAIIVSNVAVPTITSATYDASSGALVVTGTGFLQASGAANDIDTSKLTLTGQSGATYTLTSPDVEITSDTAFTVTLNATDKTAVNRLLNKAGTASNDATTYNLAAAEDWASGADAAVTIADTSGNGITVSNPVTPVTPGGVGNGIFGSLGGDDRISGDASNDIVYGGAGNDVLNGGSGNDQLNGGFGFDSAIQAGKLSDHQVDVHGNTVTLTRTDGETDTLTDVELVRFASGPNLAIAYSETEAVAHHLARTWLGRDLTAAEGNAVQNLTGATAEDVLTLFRSLPETVKLGLQDKTSDELLSGWDTDPTIIRIDATRDFTGGAENDQGYLPLGLAINMDGGAGDDVLRMLGGRDDVHLEFSGDRLELTQLSDGAMLSLKNAEMIAFDNGETVVIAHNQVEGILARLAHSFFGRDATVAEWQLGLETLQQPYDANAILDWFQQQADLQALSNTDYIQAVYNHTLGHSATNDELNQQLARLESHAIDRNWLTVEIAQSDEATAHLIGSVMMHEGWI